MSKKLIEVLHDAGFVWPGNWSYVAQDGDGGLVYAYITRPVLDNHVWDNGYWAAKSCAYLEIASDWATSVVTREQYAEYRELRANGWIPLDGGRRPVDDGVLVDVLYGNGANTIGRPADEFDWSGGDIIAYRLHAGPEFKFCDYSQDVLSSGEAEDDGVVEPGVYIAPDAPTEGEWAAVNRTVYFDGKVYRDCTILLQTDQLTVWRCSGKEYAAKSNEAMIDQDDNKMAAAIMSDITGCDISQAQITELRSRIGWDCEISGEICDDNA